ncbi:putative AlkP superfamily pyrophosphatase or phosphodiesterase [Pedobacter sp. CAN_A7]|uniref:alkaline phosphatase family protein n=1 Tax=Pedobacter sp. CAN_A7 TaxID=2787722 RepID=UPI0018C9D903
MKKIFIITLFTCFCITVAAQKKKAVFIIIDGVSKDVLDKLPTPNIDAIVKEGALLSAFQGGERGQYNQTPTISAPGYTNVISGVWYNKHNVPDNAIKAPNYHYPTIFRFFKNQYPEKKIGIFSSWEDNRTKLVGESLAQTGKIKFDYKFDGLELDTVKFPQDKDRLFMAKIDQAVTDEAARQIKENAPDLSWVYLEYTDDMGHMFGDSKKYDDAVVSADKQIGQIWEAIKLRKKEHDEDWLIVITTDHGRDPKTGHHHGGQSDRERASWIATNASPLNTYAKKGEVSVVDILPTVARHLNISLSANQMRELDGVPLTGKVSIYKPEIIADNGKTVLKWVPADDQGKLKVWVASDNKFKESGLADTYKLLGEVPIKDGRFTLDLSKLPSSAIYKIVLEAKYNTVNRWIVNKK